METSRSLYIVRHLVRNKDDLQTVLKLVGEGWGVHYMNLTWCTMRPIDRGWLTFRCPVSQDGVLRLLQYCYYWTHNHNDSAEAWCDGKAIKALEHLMLSGK